MEKKDSVLKRRNRKNGARPFRTGKSESCGKDESHEEKLAALIRRREVQKMVRYSLSAGCVMCMAAALLLIDAAPAVAVILMAGAVAAGKAGHWGYEEVDADEDKRVGFPHGWRYKD